MHIPLLPHLPPEKNGYHVSELCKYVEPVLNVYCFHIYHFIPFMYEVISSWPALVLANLHMSHH